MKRLLCRSFPVELTLIFPNLTRGRELDFGRFACNIGVSARSCAEVWIAQHWSPPAAPAWETIALSNEAIDTGVALSKFIFEFDLGKQELPDCEAAAC